MGSKEGKLKAAGPAIVMAGAFLLRASLLAAQRFHPDEALYSTWGLLIASGRDPLLRTVVLDKPPLFPYVQAVFFALFGPSEVAARLPSLCASVAGVGILYALAALLYEQRTALLAAALLALSPFDIQYAVTAFTDPLMVALGLGACLCALAGRPLESGLLLGSAVLTKPTGLLFLPLVLTWSWQSVRWPKALAATAGLTLLGVGWDVGLRQAGCGFVAAGVTRYGGLALAPPSTWLTRLAGWLAHARYLTAATTLNAALLVGVPLLLGVGLWRRRPGWCSDALLCLAVAGLLAVHTVLTFSPWDRYLLPLAPLVALLLARVLLLFADALVRFTPLHGRGAARLVAVGLMAVVYWVPVRGALRYAYPVGGDHGRYQGIEVAAAFLRGEAAPGAIVYQRLLGWELGFYLFGARLEVQHYETADYVAVTAGQQRAREQYLIAPAWAPALDVAAALQARGGRLRIVQRVYRPDGSPSFIVYRVEPLSASNPDEASPQLSPPSRP
ncbi:MAG: ArnT family glycosyltransferase [Anaerolineae bacterium]